MAELLPSVSALHALADDGPRALADQRLGRPALLRGGRRAVLVQAPAGVVAIRPRSASPWAEPLVEAAASLLAGNAVLLEPAASLAGERIAAALIRAGVPGELIAVVQGARAAGAERLCGGPVRLPGLDAAFCAPVVLRGVREDARVLSETPPGPVLAVLEASSEEQAIALAAGHAAGALSVWTDDREHGERIARAVGPELAWVNEHGQAVPSVPVRLARHVSPRRLASQPALVRSARWLPYDPQLVRARTAAARLLHGARSERLAALREGVVPVARIALRAAAQRSGQERRSRNRSGSNGAGSATGGSPQ